MSAPAPKRATALGRLVPERLASLALTLAALFWAGNFIAGRALRNDADPVTLNVLRWLICLVLLLPVVGPRLIQRRRVMLREWRLLLGLGATGIAAFHTMVYEALSETTAVNALVILALAPSATMAGAALWGEARPTQGQWLGTAVSLLGALVLVTRGEVSMLRGLQVNTGDLWMVAAVIVWAAYSLLLRHRPADLPQDVTLAASILVALVLLAPLLLLQGGGIRFHLTAATAAALLYIAIFASLVAFLLWSYGLDQVGPARAGQFINLMPVFGAVLAVLLLNERLTTAQVVGGGLVLTGVLVGRRSTRI